VSDVVATRVEPLAGVDPAAVESLLLAVADDELVLGYWDSEWTGIAPILEEDVAMSSMAQDEIGHALALYTLLAPVSGVAPDFYAYGRSPADYRFARLLGHGRTDWGFTMARRYLYETADTVRLEALERSAWPELAGLAAKMRREESYHLMHVQTWFDKLTAAPPEARDRFVAALGRLWPDALDVFAPLPGEDALLTAGILLEPMAMLCERWAAAVRPLLEAAGVVLPDVDGDAQPRSGGTNPEFAWLWNEMTMVYRLEPGATW
jgi:ring-1,2-phenylacetyl-CoA epoxidase subunit PaaC